MASDFVYSISDNVIIQCNGTSGTPKNFGDMHDADMAGTVELLAAVAGVDDMTLDYQVQPAESKGLLIDFVVAAKTAEADYIYLTGTDIDGNAQNESIDVTAGNDTYTTTLWWATITKIECTDDAVGTGVAWADGTIQAIQNRWGVVHEIVVDAVYKIDCDVQFGDDSTSSYFESLNEQVYFADDVAFQVRDSANLQLGEKQGDYGINGSMWSVGDNAACYFINTTDTTAVFNMYASLLRLRTDQIYYWGNGNYEIIDSIISGTFTGCSIQFRAGTGILTNLKINSIERAYFYTDTTLTVTGFHIHYCVYGIVCSAEYEVTGFLVTEKIGNYEVKEDTGETIYIINPLAHLTSVMCGHADSVILEQYSCDILATDEDGTALGGVTIACVRHPLVEGGDGKVYVAIQDSTAKTPDGGGEPTYWEDVDDYYDAADIPAWSPTITYDYNEAVFSELQTGRISVDLAPRNGTYVEDGTYGGYPSYAIGANFYIWSDGTNWQLSAAKGTPSWEGPLLAAGPYGAYDSGAGPATASWLAPVQIDTQYLDYAKWTTTDEIEQRWEYVFTFSIIHPAYPTLTINREIASKIIDWTIGMPVSSASIDTALQAVIESHHLDHVAAAGTGLVQLQADQEVNATKIGGEAVSGLEAINTVKSLPQGPATS